MAEIMLELETDEPPDDLNDAATIQIERVAGHFYSLSNRPWFGLPSSLSPLASQKETLRLLSAYRWWQMRLDFIHSDIERGLLNLMDERYPEYENRHVSHSVWQAMALAVARQRKTLPSQEGLRPVEQHLCPVIRQSLAAYLENHPLEQRMLVFVSNRAGLVVARDLLPSRPEAVALTPREYMRLQRLFPDYQLRHHRVFESCFQTRGLREKPPYPLEPPERFWIHSVRTMEGRLCGETHDHLWKWDGEKLTLLERIYQRWVH